MIKQTVAIITARGGSKRIPKKNIKEFCGKPIIAYSIEAAKKSAVFDEIMVSTDDSEIADLALKYGAKVPFLRSGKNADDHATTVDVLAEVLEEYQKIGIEFHTLCCIYPTAPFVTAERLRKAMEILNDTNADSVMPVTAFSFPPMRGMHIREGNLTYCWPEYMNRRSQDIETMYHDCGQFYCIKAASFLKNRKMVTEHTKAIIVPEHEVQDIDTMEDWAIAEMKYRLWNHHEV